MSKAHINSRCLGLLSLRGGGGGGGVQSNVCTEFLPGIQTRQHHHTWP